MGAVTDRSLVELQIGRERESAWVSNVYGSGRDGWQAETRCIYNLQPNITRLASLVDVGLILVDTWDEWSKRM